MSQPKSDSESPKDIRTVESENSSSTPVSPFKLTTKSDPRNLRSGSHTPSRANSEPVLDGGTTVGVIQVLCPNCSQTIEVEINADWKRATCSHCGSTVNLGGDSAHKQGLREGEFVGRFQLRKRIGQGGFGTIWEAFDPSLDRIVALKTPRRGELSAEEIEWFLREARTAAQIKHSNVVATYEVGRDGDRVYIVSEFIVGSTLAEKIAESTLSVGESVQLAESISRTMSFVHSQGVIHRDLKPSNVLVDTLGKPFLTDFGLARRSAGDLSLTVDGQILGTPCYMSPEQATGGSHAVTPSSDIYSLGVILYEMITGQVPFRGTPAAILTQVANAEPISPRVLNPLISKDLETICLKCLEKQPKRRYATAGQLADDLYMVLAGKPIMARPISRATRAVRWAKRHPLGAAVAILCGALAIGGPLAAWYWVEKAQSEAQARREADYQSARAVQAANRERQIRVSLEISQRQAARLNYVLRMRSIASQQGDIDAVAKLESLIPQPDAPDFRGLEWYYAWRWSHPTRLATIEVPSAIRGAALTFDYSRIATWLVSEELWVWNVGTGRGELLASRVPFCNLQFFPDNQTLASIEAGRNLRIWDCVSNSLVFRHDFDGPEQSAGLAVHPSGQIVAVVRRDCITYFVRQPNNQFAKENWLALDGQSIFYLAAWSQDARRFVAAGQDLQGRGVIEVWNDQTREVIARTSTEKPVYALAIAPNAEEVATAHWNHSVLQWNLQADPPEQPKLSRLPQLAAREVRYSSDGRRLIGSYDTEFRILERSSGFVQEQVRHWYGETSFQALAPDGSAVAVLPSQAPGRIRLSLIDPPMKRIAVHKQPVVGLYFDQQYSRVISCEQNSRIAASNLLDGSLLWTFRPIAFQFDHRVPFFDNLEALLNPDPKTTQTLAMGFIHNGNLGWLMQNGDYQTLDIDKRRLTGTKKLLDNAQIESASFSADGKWLLASVRCPPNAGTSVRYFLNLQNGHAQTLSDQFVKSTANLIRLSPSGDKYFVTDGSTGGIFEIGGKGRCVGWIIAYDTEKIQNAVFSHDGQQLAVATDSSWIRVLNTTRELVISNQHLSSPTRSGTALAFSPDNSSLATSAVDIISNAKFLTGSELSAVEKIAAVDLWDLETGDIKFHFSTGTPGKITSLSFGQDGRTLYAGHSDGSIYLWQGASDADVASSELYNTK